MQTEGFSGIGKLLGIVVIAGTILFSGCVNQRANHPEVGDFIRSNPASKETLSAGLFLYELLKAGNLPGASLAEHGKLTCQTEITDPAAAQFPMTRQFVMKKEMDLHPHYYLVSKDSEEAEWQLQRAWNTDLDGNILTEYPVK